jgi:hypothetical protein
MDSTARSALEKLPRSGTDRECRFGKEWIEAKQFSAATFSSEEVGAE